MDRDEIFSKLKNLVAETLEVDPEEIQETTTFDQLGADSFDKLELVTALEEEFDLQLPDEVLESINGVSDAIAAIEQEL